MKYSSTLALSCLAVLISSQIKVSHATDASVARYMNQGEENAQSITCYLRSGLQFYDLTDLKRNRSYTQSTILGDLGYEYTFNFCKYAKNPCDTDTLAYAYQKREYVFTTRCLALSDSDWTSDEVHVIPQNKTEDNRTTPSHLVYTLGGGDDCGANSEPSTITFDITCNPNVNGTPSITINDTNTCKVIFSFEHEVGCPVADFESYQSFIQNNPWFLAVLFIIFGPILAFYGRRFIPWVIGIVTGFTAFILCMIIFQFMGLLDYFDESSKGGSGVAAIISLFIAVAVGFGVGYFFKNKFMKLGFLILGGVGGFFLGGIIFTAFMAEWAQSIAVMWSTIVFFVLVGACLAYYFEAHVVILATAFIGSYLFVRGVGTLIGHWVSEVELMNQIETKTVTFTPYMIGYLCAIGVLFIIGSIFQYRHKRISDHEDHFYKA